MASRPKPAPAPDELKPTLAVTRYDRTASFLMAVIVLIGLVVAWMGALWVSQVWGDTGKAVTVAVVEIAGGDPLGEPGATFRMEGPVRDDVEPSDVEQSRNDLPMEQLANWIDAIAEIPIDVDEAQERDEGGAGSRASGVPGDSPLRSRGASGAGSGLPREQRWLIYYDPGQTLIEYARMLDFFNIELGAIVENRLIYVSHVADAKPRRRTGSPAGDDRLRWIWRGGTRREADAALLRKAGIDTEGAILMQFLPKEVEQRLAELERSAAGGRAVSEIERTAFRIRKTAAGYEFYVVDQSLF